ncbi:hypothetical protein VNO80_11600 [Phaseolus coccineus]|uniref:Uncharacterized protein n=1 Tax=Phaseolus coccineus TaxID=3886 RepID=A0AAN9RBK0_PHACN
MGGKDGGKRYEILLVLEQRRLRRRIVEAHDKDDNVTVFNNMLGAPLYQNQTALSLNRVDLAQLEPKNSSKKDIFTFSLSLGDRNRCHDFIECKLRVS